MHDTTPSDDLIPFPDSGEPSGSRISDVASAHRIYQKHKQGDELSAHNRAIVQAMIDGEPPHSESEMRRAGMANFYNLNFGEGAALLRSAVSAYTDLIDSVETLASVELPPTIGDELSRPEWQDIIAEEFHTLVTGWSEFDTTWERLCTEFVAHGVAIGYFPKDEGWKFKAGGLDDFLIPRETEVGEENIPVLIARRKMLPHQLYRCIENEKYAKDWNVKEVQKELVRVTSGKKRGSQGWYGEWAALQRRLKNNDLEVSYSCVEASEVLHFWVREFDGSVSHFITTEDSCEANDFLYKKISRFDNPNQAFVTFIRNVGNGQYHSIRGLAYDAFPHVQVSNRLRNALLDGTQLSLSTFMQPADASSMDEPPMVIQGPVAYINPEMKVVERNFVNPATQALPIVDNLSMMLQANTGSYRSRGAAADGQERTKYEVMAQQEQESNLTVSAIKVFYRSWRKLLSEIFRRVKNIKPGDKRFPEVTEFYERCEERGVPVEVVKMVRRVQAVEAVGKGSPQQRMLAFDRILSLVGSFDEQGRRAAMRDLLTQLLNKASADRYLPKDQKPRPVIDGKIADLENGALRNGQPMEPEEGENHAIHAGIHIDAMLQSVNALEEMRMSEEMDLEFISKEIQYLDLAIKHTEPHVMALEIDQLRQQEFAEYRKALQNIRAIWVTFIRLFQKMQARQEAEQPQQGEVDPDLIRDQQEHELKMQQLMEKNWVDMNMKKLKKMQDLEFSRIKNDQRLAQQIRLENVKLSPPQTN